MDFTDLRDMYRQTQVREGAKAEEDAKMMDFCTEVLSLYDKHGINDHIEWER